MFDFLKKTAQVLLNNPQDPIEAFKNNCTLAISILKSGTDDEYTLRESLDAISRDLQTEMQTGSCNFLDYLTENNIMERMADLIAANIKAPHAQAVVVFFTRFFSRDLCHYLHQMTVHKALTKIISKLVVLNWKCERETSLFIRQLYTRIAEDPITFELLQDGDQKFPLIQFLADTCTLVKPSGRLARDFIEKMFFQETKIANTYGTLMRDALYPVLQRLFVDISKLTETIDFSGSSIIGILEWCDRLFQFRQDFDVGSVYGQVDASLSLNKKLHAMAFWLDHLVRSEKIRTATLSFCITEKFVDELASACESEREELNLAALRLLLLLLNFQSARAVLLPPRCNASVDVITALPESWRASAERPYERITSDVVDIAGDRPEGRNGRLYAGILGIYSRYGSLERGTCLEVTRTLSLFYAWAPDLINQELHDATRFAMSAVKNVESEEGRNLISFVRAVHMKFVAAVKDCKP